MEIIAFYACLCVWSFLVVSRSFWRLKATKVEQDSRRSREYTIRLFSVDVDGVVVVIFSGVVAGLDVGVLVVARMSLLAAVVLVASF